MYFDVAASARLATIQQCQQITSLIIESTSRLMTFYAHAGRAVLHSSASYAGEASDKGEALPFQDLLLEHLHLADSAGKDIIHLLTSQVITSSQLIHVSLEKVKTASPPEAEIAIDNTVLAILKGAELANEVGEVSLKLIDKIESEVATRRTLRKPARKATGQK